MERGSLSCPHYILLQNILLRSEYFKGGQLHEQVQKVRGVWRNRGGLGSGLIALHPSKGAPLSIERPTAAGSREGNAGSKRVPDRF